MRQRLREREAKALREGQIPLDLLRLLPSAVVCYVVVRILTGEILLRGNLVNWNSLPVTVPVLLVSMAVMSIPVSAVTWLLRGGPWETALSVLALVQVVMAFFLACAIIRTLQTVLVRKPPETEEKEEGEHYDL
ncbi:MAG: hypothetical protein RRY53_00815 [Pseudoflavonifractor sp.]